MRAFCHTVILLVYITNLGLVARQPVIGVSNQVRLKPVCSATGTRYNIERLHIV